MTSAKQFRLIRVTDDNPQGEIVGWFKFIGVAQYIKRARYKNPTWVRMGTSLDNWLYICWDICFEELAPFKDKDGGDLYEGDNVKAVYKLIDDIIQGTIVRTITGWGIQNETKFYSMINCVDFSKLGTIHDKESRK